MDKNTFGNSKAALVLVDILTELNTPSLTRNIGRKLSTFSKMLNQLSKIDKTVSLSMGTIIHNSFIVSSNDLPTSVRSFVKNVLRGKYKAWLKENNSVLNEK